MTIEERIKEKEITLPDPLGPIGTYIPYKQVGDMLYLSGQGPMIDKIPKYCGKIGRELTKEEGYDAARLTALNILSVIKNAIGSLDNVAEFVNVTGFVNCTDDFIEQPYVINGFSDIIVELFGEAGYHARCAVPCGTLPMNTPVEVQVVLRVKN